MPMLPMPGIPSHRRPLASLARRRRAGGAARLSDHALGCVFAGRAHRRDLQRGVPRGAGPGRGGHAALGSPDAPLSQRQAASGHLLRGCLRRRAVAHGPSKSSPLPRFPVLAFFLECNKLRAHGGTCRANVNAAMPASPAQATAPLERLKLLYQTGKAKGCAPSKPPPLARVGGVRGGRARRHPPTDRPPPPSSGRCVPRWAT